MQLGFLDGYEGYLLAKYSSIYTMTKYTKLREEYYNNLGNGTSLVITTYNWPKALEACLNSALEQTVAPKEIIIADDGSKQETIDLVKRFQQSYPQSNIIHSWQEDKGFRAGMSRNRAISKAMGNYIIIIDGDLILNRHFVEDHIKNMERGCFIQGSRVITSPAVAKEIMEGKKINLFTKGLKNNMNMVRSKLLSKIFTKVDRNLRGIRSCNMSFFKEDLIKVNGFEEEIEGWGREDSELAVRLFNIGCKKKKLKFEALTCHLYHNENDRSRLKKNDEYLANAIENKKQKLRKGLIDMEEVTLVITSCGRFDLLEETLDSFFKYNTYPIKKIIITEDSTEGKKLERLISKYNDKNNNFKLIVNETRLGQLKSIDKAYREVDTKYIFHCEDDWKFLKKGFIEKSMELMEEDEKILVVGLRDKKDFAEGFFYDEDYISKNGEKYYGVKDEIFTYNPALRRKKDMDLFGLHEKLENQRYEEVLSDFYKERGFKTVFFKEPYVTHIGNKRHVHFSKNRKNTVLSFKIDRLVKKIRAKILKLKGKL
ncbi:glycosyltransferase family 2 protein [Leptotrichia hofstadii]|uniref:glycosyltransferase family 2 protein n=1 Tax=Leptotrichia hofstadii TaxID=157688 RepID=UPI0002FDFC6A|nr:glycosyltransferase [Leptotrichia hofstadii]